MARWPGRARRGLGRRGQPRRPSQLPPVVETPAVNVAIITDGKGVVAPRDDLHYEDALRVRRDQGK
eukprot:363280-Chlamydomonas_euryale.AAC.3